MNSHTPHLVRLCAAASLLAAAAGAQATTSSASVLITSFSATASGGTLVWSDPYQSFSVSALNAGGLLGALSDAFETPDYNLAKVGATLTVASAAVSTTNPQTFWATADTKSSLGAATNLPNKAEAIAGQSGSFTLSGAGSVTFTVGYVLDVAAAGGNALSDYGTTQLAFSAADSDGSSGGNLLDGLNSFAQVSGLARKVGTFSLTVNLAAGELGFYDLYGSAVAFSTASAVPEPDSWLLLACGAAGIGTWLRLRRASAA